MAIGTLVDGLTSNSCVLRGILVRVNDTFPKLTGYLNENEQIESVSASASSQLLFFTSEMHRAISVPFVSPKCLMKGSSNNLRLSKFTGFTKLTVSIIRFIRILSIAQLGVVDFFWLFNEIQIWT